MIASPYIRDLFGKNGIDKTARRVTAKIRASEIDFDYIACRGVSGLILAPVIAARMKKGLICVRKNKKDSHAFHTVEGAPRTTRNEINYIIIDDLISSGKTIDSIIHEINSVNKSLKCAAIFLYCDVYHGCYRNILCYRI